MSKKVSLANRKRAKDLGDGNVAQHHKHEELLALQSEAQPETAKKATQADKHFDEVKALVAKVKTKLAEFNEKSSRNRLPFSRQMQHDLLVNDIKAALSQKAEAAAKRGMAEDRVIMICQALADDVRVALAREGIHLNPLHLSQKRRSRM